MAFFDELKKNLSGVTDTVAKTSENVMKKSSTAIVRNTLMAICQRKWQSYARRLHLVSMRSMKLSREPLY